MPDLMPAAVYIWLPPKAGKHSQYSLDAQLKLVRDHATQGGFELVQIMVEPEGVGQESLGALSSFVQFCQVQNDPYFCAFLPHAKLWTSTPQGERLAKKLLSSGVGLIPLPIN